MHSRIVGITTGNMVFRTTWHNNVTTPIPSDIDAESLVGLLHDHGFVITMSPIVTRYELRERDSETGRVTYDVWENIDLLPFGLWKHEIQFTTAFTDKRDGVVTWIEAALGFTSQANYTVRPVNETDDQDSGWVLEEAIESSASIVLKWFIEGTLVPVRKKMHAQMIETVREREKSARESRESGASSRPVGNFF